LLISIKNQTLQISQENRLFIYQLISLAMRQLMSVFHSLS